MAPPRTQEFVGLSTDALKQRVTQMIRHDDVNEIWYEKIVAILFEIRRRHFAKE